MKQKDVKDDYDEHLFQFNDTDSFNFSQDLFPKLDYEPTQQTSSSQWQDQLFDSPWELSTTPKKTIIKQEDTPIRLRITKRLNLILFQDKQAGIICKYCNKIFKGGRQLGGHTSLVHKEFYRNK